MTQQTTAINLTFVNLIVQANRDGYTLCSKLVMDEETGNSKQVYQIASLDDCDSKWFEHFDTLAQAAEWLDRATEF